MSTHAHAITVTVSHAFAEKKENVLKIMYTTAEHVLHFFFLLCVCCVARIPVSHLKGPSLLLAAAISESPDAAGAGFGQMRQPRFIPLGWFECKKGKTGHFAQSCPAGRPTLFSQMSKPRNASCDFVQPLVHACVCVLVCVCLRQRTRMSAWTVTRRAERKNRSKNQRRSEKSERRRVCQLRVTSAVVLVAV